jgi:hypothetical protein
MLETSDITSNVSTIFLSTTLSSKQSCKFSSWTEKLEKDSCDSSSISSTKISLSSSQSKEKLLHVECMLQIPHNNFQKET